jgi:GT2 family glycosyltransferase
MQEAASPAPSFRLLRSAFNVWRHEGWGGVAWRVRLRLGWLSPDAGAPSSAPSATPKALARPDLVSVPPGGLDVFARSLRLPEVPADPVVSVLVPVHNQADYTLRCLAAVARHPQRTPFEVIVVDDASTDDTPRLLPLVANLTSLGNETNQGFLKSVNKAARAARGRLLLVLNNDTQVQEGWLDALAAAFDDPEVGLAGSKLVYPSGHLQEAGAVLRADGRVELIGWKGDPEAPEYNVKREVDHCSGACVMVPRDLFLERGGFDEAFAPAYFEDCDLSLRVRAGGRKVVYVPESTVVHHLSVSTPDEGAKLRQVEANRRVLLDRWGDVLAERDRVRTIAFYLPQYHPIPENDAWWGKGFTEWTNVARARSLYPGHVQPRLPADLGFYDLRLPEVREAQAEMAARHGLGGFCYYYYWFNGKRLLERPLVDMLEQKRPNFPFCICWANENWTRRWDGKESQVLIGQQHSPEDDRRFLESLLPFFADDRYIRVDGRPLLLLYRPQLLPDVARTTAIWREAARRQGAGELYLVAVQSFDTEWDRDPRPWGFDAAVEYPPHGLAVAMAPPEGFDSTKGGLFFDYAKSAERFAGRVLPDYPLIRAAMASWDNSPRRRASAHIFRNASPEAYGRWLEALVRQTRHLKRGDERLVFINAWNEWAEGNYLEPDQEHGHAYLEATARALEVDPA